MQKAIYSGDFWLKNTSSLKRVIIYTIILLLVLSGHHFFMQLSFDTFREIRKIIISMLSILCIGGSAILVTRKNGGRARNLFAFSMFMCGLTNTISIIKSFTVGYAGVVEYSYLSFPMLIYGSVIAYIFLLYPIEVFRPGWLNFKRGFLLFSPNLLIPTIYHFVIKSGIATTSSIDSSSSLNQQFFSFSVIISLLILSYPIFGLIVMFKYQKNYKQWCEDNYASMENIDVNWLKDYIYSNFIITISCFILVFSNNVRSVLMHNIIFLVFFLYAFYRVLFQENPYPSGYFKTDIDKDEIEISEEKKGNIDLQIQTTELIDENSIIPKNQFSNKLPEYKLKLEKWMQTEKPYIRIDFKLTDAMEVLPLNRSYLSRLFNEGYEETFYQFVMRYRIAESKRLLLSRPDLNMTRIANLSGFSSPSVFGRAFTNATKCSPLKWREKEIINNKN